MKLTRTIILGIAFLMPSTALLADDKPAADKAARRGRPGPRGREEGQEEEGQEGSDQRRPRTRRTRPPLRGGPAEKK